MTRRFLSVISQNDRHIMLLLILAWALLCIRMAAPWFGHHDHNGAWISAAARNYSLYGVANLGYLQVVNPGPAATPEQFAYYTHHPPFIVWAVALFSGPFGLHELGVRWVPAVSTLVSLAAFYVFCRRLYDPLIAPRRALLCTALYILTPMIAYFGRMPNHEPLALMFTLLFMAVFVNWLRRPNAARWWLLLLLAVCAMWTAWAPAFFLAGAGVVALRFGNGRQRVQMVALGVLTVFATLGVIGLYEWQQPGALADLLAAFIWRSSSSTYLVDDVPFTTPEFILQQITHVLPLASFTLVVMGAVGVWAVWKFEPRLNSAWLLALLGAGLAYVLVFRNAAFIHDYYKIYLMPGLAMAAASGLAFAWKIKGGRGIRRWVRPAVVGLLISSSVVNGVIFGLLHFSGMQQFPVHLTEAIRTHTTPDDLIMTNLHRVSAAIEFHTFRNIWWAMPPDEVLRLAEEANREIVYLYCGWEEAPPPETDLLEAFPYETDDPCRIIRL